MSILNLIKNHEEELNEMIISNDEYQKYLNQTSELWNKLKAEDISQEQSSFIEELELASGCIGSIHSEISYEKGFRDAVKLIIKALIY
ncbi:MAG: hypothetical protein FNP40_10815 [Dehalobacter sp. 4CP]|uniref:hypothetical protein n=1 Tax=Dehalobacter sp. CP TaxID=2594474 RepID=UPI0013C71346|nr:hypothetical protein [Dehalobacter sp.]NBJ16029.1 hypothetical protein [Dehalobacter sp. 4CP]